LIQPFDLQSIISPAGTRENVPEKPTARRSMDVQVSIE
jgi:hypothetical protein